MVCAGNLLKDYKMYYLYNFLRFKFPRYPSCRTILAKPHDENDITSYEKYEVLLAKVQFVLKNQDVMDEILSEIPLSDDTTMERYICNREKRVKKLLGKAGVTLKEYEEALAHNKAGYTLVLARCVSEVQTNNYNVEWIRAWQGNIDLQVSLDYFAVITYISEYLCKGDTGLMKKLLDVISKNKEKGAGYQETMRLVMNSFIVARQMGQCEALYKVIPSMHFKDSNISVEFVPTSRPEERSKFLVKVEENTRYNGQEGQKIDGRDGFFVEKYSIIDKYRRREIENNKAIEEISAAQFFKCYTPCWSSKKCQEIDEEENDKDSALQLGNEDEDDDHKYFYLISTESIGIIPLPKYISIASPCQGEPPKMRLRTKPAVLRFHKYKESIDPDAYFYSEALLYTHFTTEEQLENRVKAAAEDNYVALSNWINQIKTHVMPHLESNEEARAMAEIAIGEIGDILDPAGEQEAEDCEQAGLVENENFPLDTEQLNLPKEASGSTNSKKFRQLELQELNDLKLRTKNLDYYQHKIIEMGIQYCRAVVKARNCINPLPEPIQVMVGGGAGSGKSEVIKVLAQWCQLLLQQSGDNPDHPHVILAAPTGTAAANIRGQTAHTAFGLKFGTEFRSLPDKSRDERRHEMKQLRVIILDEVSMFGADTLYQIDRRLRELTMVNKPFGNLSLFMFGDLMQLQPVRAAHVFAKPKNPDYWPDFACGVGWESNSVVLLEENHRQAEDFEYANMLGRFRFGKHTEEDIAQLKLRVRNEKSSDLKGAMFVFGQNGPARKLNKERLNKLPGKVETFKAVNIHPTLAKYSPSIDNKGNVKNTNFQAILELKVNCRIKLTFNVDTVDCLTNGTMGVIQAFHRNADGKISAIMVKFDQEHVGKEARERHNLAPLYPGCTPVEKVQFKYCLGNKNSLANSAKVIQFPLW